MGREEEWDPFADPADAILNQEPHASPKADSEPHGGAPREGEADGEAPEESLESLEALHAACAAQMLESWGPRPPTPSHRPAGAAQQQPEPAPGEGRLEGDAEGAGGARGSDDGGPAGKAGTACSGGPEYKAGEITQGFCVELLQWQKEGGLLATRCAHLLVMDTIEHLKGLATLVEVAVPAESEITVCGDVHGQYYDLLNIWELNGLPSEANPYLFNGDFVDRGSFSVEVVLALFAWKLLFPRHLHLARGNHETQSMNRIYGFEGEVRHKYDEGLYALLCEAFCLLPLCHVLNSCVFVVHGGLFSRDGVTLDDIRSIDRVCEPLDEGLMVDMLWSDPQPGWGRAASKRGVGVAFGQDVTENFLKTNDLRLVIRSHEMCEEGYSVEHRGQLITVFSAPNYCDQMGNRGALLRLDGETLTPRPISFAAVPHPPVMAMQYAVPMPFYFGGGMY